MSPPPSLGQEQTIRTKQTHQEPTANQNTTHLPISRVSFLECSRAPSNQSMLVQSSAFFRSTAGHNSDLRNRIRHRSCSEDKLERLHRHWVALSLRMGSHKHPGLVCPEMRNLTKDARGIYKVSLLVSYYIHKQIGIYNSTLIK